MKWPPILHGIAAFAGILGVLSLIWFWVALLAGGTFLGITAEHSYERRRGAVTGFNRVRYRNPYSPKKRAKIIRKIARRLSNFCLA